MSPLKETGSPELTELDPRGDVVFVVGSAAAEDTPARSFRACSRTMARVSPVFDRMLNGKFTEAKPAASGSGDAAADWVVQLRDDKPDAFALFASIAHAQYRCVPRSLTIDKFYDLTVLTHYYDATPMLTPWLQGWISGIGEVPDVGSEGLLMPKLLWISWELGHKQLFESTARRMVMECQGSMIGEDAGLEELSMPPDIIERINAIRSQTIQSIMDVFRDLYEKLVTVDEGPRWCLHASYMGPHRCESMILGSMTFCLTRAGLWPIPETSDVDDSVVMLYSTLMNLVIHDIGRPGEKGGVDHSECNPRAFLMGQIKDILAEVPSPVTDAHKKHLDRQIQKLLISLALPPNPEPSGAPPKVLQPSPQHSEPSQAGSPWPGQTEQDRHLYEQFDNSTIFLLYSTYRDDLFRRDLCQLANRSEALCSILIATHLYVSSPANPSSLFEEYYLRGLHLFRKQLESYDGTVNVGVMYAGLFICTLNLFQSAPWSVHLELMTTVYGLGGSLHGSAIMDNPDACFPLELMAVMDMPTFVRGRSTMTLGIWHRLRQAQETRHAKVEGGIEVITSLPRSLLDIFSSIQDESSEDALLSWPGELGEIPQIHLWEAYRFAGALTGRRLRRGQGLPSSAPSTELLVGRLVAAIDALCDTRTRPEYDHLLTTNSLLYPYVAARLEVATLQRRPSWMEVLRRAVEICQPYGRSANVCNIADMLDEAWKAGDDDYDIDEHARRRNVEIALF
ncbi:hypothetical protein CGCF413_v014157 [Colletotrichum fructicola]|nr:hypothetical protein CGCF413_v014157 [Colletotrichum fructicola]